MGLAYWSIPAGKSSWIPSAVDCVLGDLLLLGEVGLTGELRQVGQLERRLREAAQMGFRRAIVPKQKKRLEISNMEIIEESLITSVIDHLWRE